MEDVEICIITFKNKKNVESYSLTYLFNDLLYTCKSFKQDRFTHSDVYMNKR